MEVYENLADKSIVKKVNEVFYDKVYDHPWLSLYFKGVEKEHIVNQQTDFIVGAIGGPKNFGGRMPSNAHPHMMITDELFDLRKALLVEAFLETQAPEELREIWLRIDEAFRHVIVKKSIEECVGRWKTDEILNFPNPEQNKKVA